MTPLATDRASTEVEHASPSSPRGGGLASAGVALGTALAAVVLGWLVVGSWGPLLHLDAAVLTASHGYAVDHRVLVLGLKVLSRIGVPAVYEAVILGVAVLLWRRGLRTRAVYAVATVDLGMELPPLLKGVVERPRPVLADPVSGAGGYSFPSGHAVCVTVTALVLAVLAWRLLTGAGARGAVVAAAVTAVVVIGAARVSLGVHYLSDVVAGVLVGVSWVAAATAVAAAVGTARRARRHDQTTERKP